MKSTFKKLKGLGLNKHGKDQRQHQPPAAPRDKLIQASQDMLDMRNCYDSLLSAAAATTNCAYEFSEAFRELGICLLAKNALNDDEEIGKVLLMVGKAHFELQKLVDNYRVHIIKTITTPSESLIKELQTVEDLSIRKTIGGGNRVEGVYFLTNGDIYKSMILAQIEKGRARNSKGEHFSQQQLKAALEDYQEETTLFLFRLKSLKQGQSRSLLTQAARHHSAQLNFFRRGVKSLEVVEPYVKEVAEQLHIDYQFSGLDDDGSEEYKDGGDDYGSNDDRDLSYDYGQHGGVQDISTIRKSVEVDQADQTSVTVSATEVAKENLDRSPTDFLLFSSGTRAASLSAPLLDEKKLEVPEKLSLPSSIRKSNTYVLPTPDNAKGLPLISSGDSVSAHREVKKDGFSTKFWHSTPLHPNMLGQNLKDVELQNQPKTSSILKESNTYSGPIRAPASSGSLAVPTNASVSARIELQSFTGPLTNEKSLSSKPTFAMTGSMSSVNYFRAFPMKPSYTPPSQQINDQRAYSTISTSLTSPRINEPHELPRPPIAATNDKRPSLIAHSAPLAPRSQTHHETSRPQLKSSYKATPLPPPPGAMSRCFSIPSNGTRVSSLTVAGLLEPSHRKTTEVISWPAQTP